MAYQMGYSASQLLATWTMMEELVATLQGMGKVRLRSLPHTETMPLSLRWFLSLPFVRVLVKRLPLSLC